MTATKPTVYTLGLSELPPVMLGVYGLALEPRIALDLRKGPKPSVKRVAEMLRWHGKVRETKHVPDLAQWYRNDARGMLDRLVATIRRKSPVLLMCSCPAPWRCERRRIAARLYGYLGKDLNVVNLGYEDAKAPKFETKSAPTCEQKWAPATMPDRIESIEKRKALIAKHRTPESAERLARVIGAMDKSLRYIINAENDDLRKRSVTGWYSGLSKDGSKVAVEDDNGRMQRVPIADVTLITVLGEVEQDVDRPDSQMELFAA